MRPARQVWPELGAVMSRPDSEKGVALDSTTSILDSDQRLSLVATGRLHMGSEYIRIGTDSGGVVEITLRPAQYKRPAERTVVIRTSMGSEFKYDHPKDVGEFLKLPLSEIIQITDKLNTDALLAAKVATANKARSYKERTGKVRRMLEV